MTRVNSATGSSGIDQSKDYESVKRNQNNDYEISVFTNGGKGNGNVEVDAGDFADAAFANFVQKQGWFGKKFNECKDKIVTLKLQYDIDLIAKKTPLKEQDVDNAVILLGRLWKNYITSEFRMGTCDERGNTIDPGEFTEMNENHSKYQDSYNKIYEAAIKSSLKQYFFDKLNEELNSRRDELGLGRL